jgi:hypothetical protein
VKLNQVNKQESRIILRYKQIEEELNGYWKNDRWDPLDCPLYTKETKINK